MVFVACILPFLILLAVARKLRVEVRGFLHRPSREFEQKIRKGANCKHKEVAVFLKQEEVTISCAYDLVSELDCVL